MKQFAQLDSNNIVIQVIAVPDDYDTDAKGSDYINNTLGLSGKWLQTCLYTQGNVLLSAAAKTITHTRVDGKGDVTIFVPAITGLPLRYNFASIGYKYDPVNDAFYDSVQLFPSWNLDYTTYT